MEVKTAIQPHIDVDSTLPEGVSIVSIIKEVIGIIGLSSDNGVWLWYNGTWKKFIINYDIMSEETQAEEVAAEEVAPEGTESTETSEVAADEAQAETASEEAPAPAEAATEEAE